MLPQKVREPNDVSKGPAIYKVHVVGDEGRVNLGTSFETADGLTGKPDLVAKAVIVESITTDEGGIKQRYSFEVDGSTWFLLEGELPEGASAHPFRAGAIELAPAGQRYAINPPPPPRSEFTSMGCLTYPLSAGGVIAVLNAELVGWKIAAWVVWTLGVLSLLLASSVAASEFREE